MMKPNDIEKVVGESIPNSKAPKSLEVLNVAKNTKPISSNDKVEVPDLIHNAKMKITYQKGRFLGKGAFAKCYEVLDPNTKTVLACKVVNKGLLVKPHHREKMAQEIAIHRELNHENIVDFHSNFEDENNVYIVLGLCSNKSLMEMHKRRRVVSEPEARYFMRQLASAILYLHEKKRIIHRDLKLGNIFINENMELKIGDFGLATCVEAGERKKTLCGTPNYIAPEILAKRGHSFEVDIWSLGCILYTLLVGRPPFETNTLKDTYSKIRRADYNIPTSGANRVGLAARDLITKILQVEPSIRPTAQDVVTHDFLTNYFIPSFLPVSSLTTAPRFERPKPKTGVLGNSTVSNRATTVSLPKSIGEKGDEEKLCATNSSSEIEQGYDLPNFDMVKVLNSLMHQLTDVLHRGKGVNKDVPLINDESEDPSLSPVYWISKWVDYSDKFGFGYQLSDDSIGVSYNDQTKMVLFPKSPNVHYIDQDGKEFYYSTDNYPDQLQKKFKLLVYFKDYMTENLMQSGGKAKFQSNCIARLPNMWSWFRTSRAVVMVLTNGTVQINNFRNHSKTVLCPLVGAVSIIEPAARTLRTFSLSSLRDNGLSEDLAWKLEYSLQKCEVVLGSPQYARQLIRTKMDS